jgi:DNA topoisomerase I
MILVIVESPAKCKKIESFLGKNYKCLASYGHIREFANGLKSIDYNNNYKVVYKISSNKQKYVKILRAAIKKATEVMLATDDDREGEAIAWHICKVFNLNVNTTKRIIFHEITKKALLKAVNNPTRINMNKVNAQKSRQILDLIVGFTTSPILWKHISWNSKKGLSAGRCQTPALNLVYDNDKLCKQAKGEEVYETKGLFTSQNIVFTLDKLFVNKNNVELFLEKSKEFRHMMSITDKKRLKKSPPKPFTTSLLQQKASNLYNFSPKNTMKLAQTLYENGFITYMRTDNQKYSKDFVNSASDYIVNKWSNKYLGKNLEKITLQSNKSSYNGGEKKEDKKEDKKEKKNDLAQEAHEAIRPTKIEIEIAQHPKIGKYEQKLYKLIWENSVESCMAPSMYDVIYSKIDAPDELKYKNKTEKNVFLGWEIVNGTERDDSLYEFINSLGDDIKKVSYKQITSEVTIKKLKTHYTEAKLVQLLEKKGIGRPSTFSSLVSKIIDRGYVKKGNINGREKDCENFVLIKKQIEKKNIKKIFGAEKNKLVMEPVGIVVMEFLKKHLNEVFNYEYTKNMEGDLDKIKDGNMKLKELCDTCRKQLTKSIATIDRDKALKGKQENKHKNKKGIQIDDNHEWIIGKYGPVIKCEKDGETTFKKVKNGIDIEKLKNGEYSLNDVLENQTNTSNSINLGQIDNKEVILKKGKYGLYVNYNNKNTSLKDIRKKMQHITLKDVEKILKTQKNNSNILREINENASIRKGKWGPYVFYKTDKMKKPRFLKIKGIDWHDIDLDWVFDNL